MSILPPRVIGPLSPCSSRIRLQGQFSGATIEVFADDELVISPCEASGPDEFFDLDPGESLPPLSVVWAVQTFEGERSLDPERENGVEVMGQPRDSTVISTVRAPRWEGHLHVCAGCVRLAGVIPGALVTVRDSSRGLRAEGQSVDTVVRMRLNEPIMPGERLYARQTACGIDSPGPDRESPEPTQPLADLPAPEILDPLVACGRRVHIGNILEGATVSLERSIGPDREFCSTIPNPYRDYSEADQLEARETVTARQYMRACDLHSGPSEERIVDGPSAVSAPEIEESLCAGSTRLQVSNLQPYATVYIHYSSESEPYRISAPSAATEFLIPPLKEDDVISVVQELCGGQAESNEGIVVSCTGPEAPQIELPYECASVVYVTKVMPGARVRIYSDDYGEPGFLERLLGCIGEETVPRDKDYVFVSAPTLIALDMLVAVQTVAGADIPSIPQFVRLFDGSVPTPVVRAVLETDRVVTVENVLPQAVVEVYVQGDFRGSAIGGTIVASGSEPGTGRELLVMEVPIVGDLSEDHQVTARQRFCGQESGLSDRVSVRSCRRRIQVGLKSLDAAWLDQLRAMARWMQRLFRHHGFEVVVVDEEVREDLSHLRNLHLADDDRELAHELLSHREGLGEHDVAVFMVNTIMDTAAGVSLGRGGAIVEYGSEYYGVAHEVGHVLGLEHDDSAPSERLMYRGARGGTHSSPSISASALTREEVERMAESFFTYGC